MECPVCATAMTDVTESWDNFVEAQGAEYLAEYVTIWHCPHCGTVVGSDDHGIEWVMEPEVALADEEA